MRYRFLTCDVFTAKRFGGNQLAVLPDAAGLGDRQMQQIAAEFNHSETTFVLPPRRPEHLARVRIFTPRAEMPFAGHPTVGTALVLAWLGRVPFGTDIVLEEAEGPVPVTFERDAHGSVAATFTAPAPPVSGPPLPAAPVAQALGLTPDEVLDGGGLPCVASCGAPFLLVELASREALARARVVTELPEGHGVYLFTRDAGSPDAALRARMFAPRHGIVEDPATGSAAAALAGHLAVGDGLADGWHCWRIAQGVEMGRPSLIETAAYRDNSRVTAVRVGGRAVPVAEGTIEVGP